MRASGLFDRQLVSAASRLTQEAEALRFPVIIGSKL
jgi:hypothetical protein